MPILDKIKKYLTESSKQAKPKKKAKFVDDGYGKFTDDIFEGTNLKTNIYKSLDDMKERILSIEYSLNSKQLDVSDELNNVVLKAQKDIKDMSNVIFSKLVKGK